MENMDIKTILKQYENRKFEAEKQVEIRKQNLYKQYPRIQEIEEELNKFAFSSIKEILFSSKSPCDTIEILNEKIQKLKEEKQAILLSLHLPEDYLLPHYTCPDCKDTGYISTNYESSPCHCLKQQLLDKNYNQSNLNICDDHDFSHFNLDFYSSEINESLYHVPISPKENMKHIQKLCESFIQNFDDPNRKNLLFTGNTGLGKTFLSNCIAKELLNKNKTVLYQTAPVMLDSVIDYKFGKSSYNILQTILDVDLLIIDDLGTEYKNDVKFSELYEILNTRLLNQTHKITKTIISTNFTLNNLFDNYDERIVSRLIGYYDICKFFGEDIRFQKAKQTK